MAEQPRYRLQGHLLGACSCDWGCPCNFEARPTQGWCHGSYVWHVEHGHYQGTSLARIIHESQTRPWDSLHEVL